MARHLPVVGFLLLVIGSLAAVLLSTPTAPDPPLVPVKDELLINPAKYDGRVIRVRTVGFRVSADAAGVLVYRKNFFQPSNVIVYLPPGSPEHPEFVTGKFSASSPGASHVIDARTPPAR